MKYNKRAYYPAGLFRLLSISLFLSCGGAPDCEMGPPDDEKIYRTFKPLTEVSYWLFPDSLPANCTFTSNIGESNAVATLGFSSGSKDVMYRKDWIDHPCGTYYKEYGDRAPYIEQLVKTTQKGSMSFVYSRTRYSPYVNYENAFSGMLPDTSMEIITLTIQAPLKSYAFLLPIGNMKAYMSNYTYLDTITLGGTLYSGIYNVYADSALIDPQRVVVEGIYYHAHQGLLGYYLSNGNKWERR